MNTHENEWNAEGQVPSEGAGNLSNGEQACAAGASCDHAENTHTAHRYGHDTQDERRPEAACAMEHCCLCTTCEDRCLCMEALPWCGFLGISYGAAWLSSLFVRNVGSLSFMPENAWWMPPAWLFGAVWTVLYFLLGTAVWLAWRRVGCQRASSVCVLFITLLILQMGWTFAFFYLQSPFGAFIDLIWTLAVTILLAMSIAPIHRFGAMLLIPQVIWLIYALGLNYAYLK